MVNYRSLLLAGIVTVAVAQGAFLFGGVEQVAERPVWVAVSLFDGRRSSTVEYYGTMEVDAFNDIVSNTITEGFFKLQNTSWMDDEGIKLMQESQLHGRSRGYSGTAHFLVKTITRVVLLDDQFVEETLLRVIRGGAAGIEPK